MTFVSYAFRFVAGVEQVDYQWSITDKASGYLALPSAHVVAGIFKRIALWSNSSLWSDPLLLLATTNLVRATFRICVELGCEVSGSTVLLLILVDDCGFLKVGRDVPIHLYIVTLLHPLIIPLLLRSAP